MGIGGESMMSMPPGMPPGMMPPAPPMPYGGPQAPLPFPPQPNGMPTSGGPPPIDAQGTNPRDMSSALLNKGGQSPFMTDEKGGVPAWLEGFLKSPFAKWKGESQQAMQPSTTTPAFQPPMQMGQTHQQPQAQMGMPPMWAMSHNAPTG